MADRYVARCFISNYKIQITNDLVPFGYIIYASGDITCTCNLHLTPEKIETR
jgi:hypothetical protein